MTRTAETDTVLDEKAPGADALPRTPTGAVRREVLGMLRAHRGRLLLADVLVLVAAAPVLAAPLLVREAVDAVVRRSDAGALASAALLLGMVAVLGALASVALGRVQAQVGERVLADLRVRGLRSALDRAVGQVAAGRRGDLLSRLSTDVETLGEAVRSALPALIRAGSLLAAAVIALVVLDPLLALLAVSGIPVVVLLARRFARRSGPVYADLRERSAEAVGVLGESLGGAALTRQAGRERDRERQHAAASEAVVQGELAAMKVRNRFYPALELLQVAVTVFVLVAGVLLVLRGATTPGTVAGAVLAVASVYGPVEELAEWADELLAARASLDRVVGLLALPPGLPEPAAPVALPSRGALTLSGVCFGYRPERPVVRDVDVLVGPGEQVALVGATGAGKTTLARLTARLADPDSGSVGLGGIDLRDAALADVRRRVLLVTQDGHLSAGSLADNVRLAHPAAGDDVEAALDAVGALDWARALPAGLSTDLLGGTGLSAGQRQLVALARIVLADPAVVVLDEATSALDPGTERVVEQALSRTLAGRAVLLIAHRVCTAARADRVVVLDAGRVVEAGPPADLLAGGGAYAREWARWTS